MKSYIKLGKKLFPIYRSITGAGVVKTLRILKKEVKGLKIKHIKSGTKVFDWKISPEWNVKNAYVKDKNGKKIIDFKKNNLHLVSYSKPINKFVTKKKLIKHLHFLKKQKKAIPYVTSYYKKYWGFCLSYYDYKKLIKNYKDNEKFFVKIKSKFKNNGKLHYGELLIKGKEEEEILISTNICHPAMANNELSGPLVAIALAKYFKKSRKINKSIRFLFLPETIGSIAYIKFNLNKLKKNVIGGYTLTCIGDNRNYSYLLSKYKNSPSDIAALKACRQLKLKFKKYSYLKSESDERRYNAPFVNLGIGSIMRTKYHSFPEYHTSLDNFKLVTAEGLRGGFNLVQKAIKNLDKIYLKNNSGTVVRAKKKKSLICKTVCEPNLGKRNLYPLLSKKDNEFKSPIKILDFLQFTDGTNNLIDISNYINCSLAETRSILKILLKQKLVAFTK